MKDIELPEPAGHVHSDGEFCWDKQPGLEIWPISLYTADQLRAAVEADRAQRVPDGYREVLSNLLWAATERDAKNRIRQFDEFLDAARSMLDSTPAQPVQQPVERKPINCWCEACDLAQGNLLGRTRMSLCPECGDKRCPRAKHHDAPCNGIRE